MSAMDLIRKAGLEQGDTVIVTHIITEEEEEECVRHGGVGLGDHWNPNMDQYVGQVFEIRGINNLWNPIRLRGINGQRDPGNIWPPQVLAKCSITKEN